uniref:Kinesin motor domain-containing protein n=1 Tax=Globisporangium ultimum (strain ATCC 200006 / CBS 805.95 / DAOM BR144) TaxID=431595 RepID=K3WQ89_GLOUD
MIAAVSPCSSSSDHTVNTLRYADRVKEKRVSADVFDEGGADVAVVDLDDVNFETDVDDGSNSPTRVHEDDGLEENDDELYDDEGGDDQPEEGDGDGEGEDELREAHRYRSESSQEIKMLHHSLRKHSRGSNGESSNEYDLETLHGVESAELLTEEGQLLAEIQGDNVVDYDIDKYITRLDEILTQKAQSTARLRKQLSAFRKRCEEEESASKRVNQVPTY